MATEHYVNYPASVSSLKELELACEYGEASLLANIKSLELGIVGLRDAEEKVTIAVFEAASNVPLGRLTFVEYKSDVDEGSLNAVHQSKGDTFLFKGVAYIQNNPVTLLAFGGHGTGDCP